MKKVKAAKSASDIGLRKGATGAASTRSAFPKLRQRNTWAPTKKGKGKGKGKGGNSADKPISTNPKKVKSTRDKKEVDPNIEDAVVVSDSSAPKNVKSERVKPSSSGPKAVGGSSKPKAIAGPSKPPSKPKKNAGPKTKADKTRTVFVAEPVVKLEEGPDFGKITHEITKTKQPANPRQFR